MVICVNGAKREVPVGMTIASLLEELQLDSRQLAVERNLELAPREEHPSTVLADGDRIEIVTLVGGG